jgi:multicomponent Na+:H+ antiporter subunit F
MTLETFALFIILPLLMLSFLVGFIRMVLGPTLPDRVVVLELLGAITTGIICVYAVARKQPLFLDVAIVIALISFLATVAFAYFVEKQSRDSR